MLIRQKMPSNILNFSANISSDIALNTFEKIHKLETLCILHSKRPPIYE